MGLDHWLSVVYHHRNNRRLNFMYSCGPASARQSRVDDGQKCLLHDSIIGFVGLFLLIPHDAAVHILYPEGVGWECWMGRESASLSVHVGFRFWCFMT